MQQNLIQDGGLNARLQRRLGLDSAPAVALAPEIFPVYQSDRYTADLDLLGQVRRCSGGIVLAAIAAQQPIVALRNPANSGIIAVVNRIVAWNDSRVDSFGIEVTQPVGSTGTTAGTRRFTDSGLVNAAANALPVCSIAGFTAGGVTVIGPRFISSNLHPSVQIQEDYVLRPSSNLDVVWGTSNEGVYMGFFWTERRALPSEL